MSTQTFSKVFLFPNNKRKPKSIFPITTGPARGNNWPTATFGLRNRAKGKGGGLARSFGPRPSWPSSAKARRHATPAFQAPWRCGRCQWAGGRCWPCPGKRTCAQGSQEGGEPEQATQRDGEGTGEAFHGGVKRGGAMTECGKTRKTAIPCSNGVPAVSTRCRGARQSDVRLIAGSGGAPAANFAGGAAVAMAARDQSSVRAKQRGSAGEWSGERSGVSR